MVVVHCIYIEMIQTLSAHIFLNHKKVSVYSKRAL